VLLVVTGALWDLTDWRGWMLLPVFVGGRAVANWLVGRLLPRFVPGHDATRSVPLVTPISPLSVAIVVGVQATYRGPAIPWIVTAVLAGTVVTEVLIWRTRRRSPFVDVGGGGRP
jgi:hypothetical protein